MWHTHTTVILFDSKTLSKYLYLSIYLSIYIYIYTYEQTQCLPTYSEIFESMCVCVSVSRYDSLELLLYAVG